MLKISDKDMESLKMPLGARRKLRANLEVLRYVPQKAFFVGPVMELI